MTTARFRPLSLASATAALLVATAFGGCDCSGVAAGADGGPGGEGEGEGDNAGSDAGFVGDSGVPADCVDGLQSIALTPADSTVTLDGTSAAPVTFTASGTLDNGSTVGLDVTRLGFTVSRDDDGDPGTISDGVYQPNPLLGGVVTVSASDGCVSGSTTITFVIEATLGTPQSPAADWDAQPVEAGAVPVVVYPSNQTRFPRNIFQTLFQWQKGDNAYTEFRLTFDGAGSNVTVYTDGVDAQCAGAATAGCFEAGEQAWALIAGSNAGGTVTWTVDALDHSTTPATVRRGASIEIGFSRRDVQGAIFYWSTTSAGIRRAAIGDAAPEDYIDGKPGTTYDVEGKVKCVACHTVSRDGTKIVAPVDSQNTSQSLWVMDVTPSSPPTPVVTAVEDTRGHGFATISPDDSLVAAAWAGRLWLVDATDGAYLGDLDLAGGDATHPDWSPDGSAIAYADAKGDAPGNAGINLLPATGPDTFAAPVTLVEQQGDRTNIFPSFSPDSRWLAFARGKGGHDDVQAQLFVVDAQGPTPGTPVELVNANRVVNNDVTDGLHQNSQPTWAPPGDLYWIAFNSKRPYGVVLPSGTQQILGRRRRPRRARGRWHRSELPRVPPPVPGARRGQPPRLLDPRRARRRRRRRRGRGRGRGRGRRRRRGRGRGRAAVRAAGQRLRPGLRLLQPGVHL